MRRLQSTAQFSYGLKESVDLQISMPYLRQTIRDAQGRHAGSGPLDSSVTLKWRYFERYAVSLAIKGGFSVPTGDEDRGFGTGRPALGAMLIVSYQPGRWAFHSHAGYRWNNNSVGERTSLAHLSGAITFQATERIRLIADLSADSNPDRRDSSCCDIACSEPSSRQHRISTSTRDSSRATAIRPPIGPCFSARPCVGETSPGDDLARPRKTFRAYSLIYPLVWALSRLDALVPASGYMLIASLRRRTG